MAIRNMVYKGDPLLRKICRPIEKFDKRLGILLDDMTETMLMENGVGLAAPQVGVIRRAVIIDKGEGEGDIVEMINPVILETDGEQVGSEGCLSVPGKFGIVSRPMKVKAKYQDRFGEFHEIEAEGLTARAICHECDHLDGKLFTDISSRMLTDEEINAMGETEGDA